MTDQIVPLILIVEDDDATREAMKALLERDGYRVVTAADGQEGIEQLRGGLEPSLILLDLSMPRMDGFQFRREQVQDSRLALIPVVVHSAGAAAERGTLALGAAAYLEKPVDVERLLALVAQLCNSSALAH